MVMSIMSAVTSIYYIPLTAMALDNEAMGYEYDYSSEETAFRTTVRTSVRSLQVVPVRDHAHCSVKLLQYIHLGQRTCT